MEGPLIGILGEFTIDGERVGRDLSQKARTFLAALAVVAPEPLTCEELAPLLWGASTPLSYKTGLRRCAHEVRNRIGPSLSQSLLTVHGTGYCLGGRFATDAQLFRFLIAPDGRGPRDRIVRLRHAGELWRGRVLAGIDFRSCLLDSEILTLQSQYMVAEEELAELLVSVSDGATAELMSELGYLAARHPESMLLRNMWENVRAAYHCEMVAALWPPARSAHSA